MKVLIVTNTPSPYRIPLFNALQVECKRNGVDLVVVFLAPSYARRKWIIDEKDLTFRYISLTDPHISSGEFFFTGALSLPKVLINEDPDLIITAGFSPASVWTLLYSRLFSKPYIIWSGETPAEAALRLRFSLIRKTLRRWITRYAAGFLVYGRESKRYLISLGCPPSDIVVAINTVDTAYMSETTARLRPNRGNWLHKNKLPSKNVLFVGYLEPRKGVRYLLQAVQKLHTDNPGLAFATHLVGTGSQENELKSMVERENIPNVHFWGYKQKEELPQFFAIADVLAFCSTSELYGLVPIEAMAAGVPVIGSPLAGCTPDLFENGSNGLVVDPRDIVALAHAVRELLENDTLNKSIAQNGQRTIAERFTIHHTVEGFLKMICRFLPQ